MTPARARVFLDANVLFSAAYRAGAGLLALWRIRDVTLVTSSFAAEEARRNLDSEDQRERLSALLAGVEVVLEAASAPLPAGVHLPDKDAPILRAAVAAGATHLLTGDWRDFGRLIGKEVLGMRVQTPGDFLRSHSAAPR